MGDRIVGSGRTPRLSVWNTKQAMEDCGAECNEKAPSSTSSQGGGNDEANGPPKKAQKRPPACEGLLPHRCVQVEDDDSGFNCSDIEWIRKSGVLIGAGRSRMKSHMSLRHCDLEKESVVGLHCGLKVREACRSDSSCARTDSTPPSSRTTTPATCEIPGPIGQSSRCTPATWRVRFSECRADRLP